MLLKQRFDPANVDTDYFVDGGTGDFLYMNLIGEDSIDTPDGLAHQLAFVSSGDINTAVFVVSGLDADGNVIEESVTGITTSPVETTKYFKTVNSIESDNDISTETLDVGFVDEFVSPTIPLDWLRNVPSHWFGDQNGTITWSVDFAIESLSVAGEQSLVKWKNPSASLESETADSSAFVDIGAGYTAARLRVASYTNTADITLYAVQPEIV